MGKEGDMAKEVTNISEAVFHHSLFSWLEPDFSVITEDDVAARLMEDYPGKFSVADYAGDKALYSVWGCSPVVYVLPTNDSVAHSTVAPTFEDKATVEVPSEEPEVAVTETPVAVEPEPVVEEHVEDAPIEDTVEAE